MMKSLQDWLWSERYTPFGIGSRLVCRMSRLQSPYGELPIRAIVGHPSGMMANPSGIGHACPRSTPGRARLRTKMSALRKTAQASLFSSAHTRPFSHPLFSSLTWGQDATETRSVVHIARDGAAAGRHPAEVRGVAVPIAAPTAAPRHTVKA